MSARQLVAVGLAGAAAWLVFRRLAPNLAPAGLSPPLALPWGWPDPFGVGSQPDQAGGDQAAAPGDYEAATAARESQGDPAAKNPRSSASGAYQFTKATWQSVGGAWGPDPSKPFGGLTPSLAEQQSRFHQLTATNAAGLAHAGQATTDGALYIAHFLGLGTALRVLTAAPSTLLANLVGSKVMAANPQLRGFTVGDFLVWANNA